MAEVCYNGPLWWALLFTITYAAIVTTVLVMILHRQRQGKKDKIRSIQRRALPDLPAVQDHDYAELEEL